jgi:hypothetical protein
MSCRVHREQLQAADMSSCTLCHSRLFHSCLMPLLAHHNLLLALCSRLTCCMSVPCAIRAWLF